MSSEGAPGEPDALRAEVDPRPLSTNRGVTFTDPFGLCPEKKRDKDGKCPGGLTVREWQNVESAANKHLRAVAQQRILAALNEGRIRGGSLGRKDAGVRATSATVIRLNREIPVFDAKLSAFEWDPQSLGRILAHEDRHVQQLRELDILGKYLSKIGRGLYQALQDDADAYAAANLVP